MNKNVYKGILLGYDPHTNRNVIYYDVDTHRINLAPHVLFDEGTNDLPMADTPRNAQHLQIVDNLQPLPE